MNLNFVIATTNDLPKILESLRLAAERLQAKGVNQWGFWLNPPQERIDWLQEGIDKKEHYWVENEEHTIVGMIRVMLYQDELYWGKQPIDAAYIHSLMILPEFAGQNIGRAMMAQAEKIALANDLDLMRLDCKAESTNLCRYYESLGYIKVFDKQMLYSYNNFYEKKLGMREK